MCHMVGRDSSAVKFDRVWITFILSFILLAEAINWWRWGGNPSTQRKPLMMSFRVSCLPWNVDPVGNHCGHLRTSGKITGQLVIGYYCQPVWGTLRLSEEYDFEGSRPQWYISTIQHAWDIPFWFRTLDLFCELLICDSPPRNESQCARWPFSYFRIFWK